MHFIEFVLWKRTNGKYFLERDLDAENMWPALEHVYRKRACTLSAELLLTPSKILPKSSRFASRGTYPWSASVESVIHGVLNASLPSQSPELDFQPLELDKLARNLDHLHRPKPPDDDDCFYYCKK